MKSDANTALITGAVAACIGLFAFVLLLFGWGLSSYSAKGPHQVDVTVTLARGSGLNSIAETLKKSGVIRHPWVFKGAAKLTGAARELKAGDYLIPAGASPKEILAKLRLGQTLVFRITIPEGWTVDQVNAALMALPDLTGNVAELPQGTLLPATYEYRRGESRAAILSRMVSEREKVLDELWPTRAPNLPFSTPEEAIILASVVEKETGVASERPRVAAVFINRLRKGMRLESDPTIIYGLNGGKPLGRGLRRSEIEMINPYNTYQVDGLPAGPICNPGRESIAAVLNPAQTDDLFFVADGSGGHAFAPTYAQHQANVARWRQIEAQAAAR
jgi:UPF0755 protein